MVINQKHTRQPRSSELVEQSDHIGHTVTRSNGRPGRCIAPVTRGWEEKEEEQAEEATPRSKTLQTRQSHHVSSSFHVAPSQGASFFLLPLLLLLLPPPPPPPPAVIEDASPSLSPHKRYFTGGQERECPSRLPAYRSSASERAPSPFRAKVPLETPDPLRCGGAFCSGNLCHPSDMIVLSSVLVCPSCATQKPSNNRSI